MALQAAGSLDSPELEEIVEIQGVFLFDMLPGSNEIPDFAALYNHLAYMDEHARLAYPYQLYRETYDMLADFFPFESAVPARARHKIAVRLYGMGLLMDLHYLDGMGSQDQIDIARLPHPSSFLLVGYANENYDVYTSNVRYRYLR